MASCHFASLAGGFGSIRVVSSTAERTSSRFRTAIIGLLYRAAMTSPCSVILMRPSRVPRGCAWIVSFFSRSAPDLGKLETKFRRAVQQRRNCQLGRLEVPGMDVDVLIMRRGGS